MTGQSLDDPTSTETDAPSLTAEQARELTDRMKSGLTQIWEIIVVAHRGRAWLALGYASWDQYVQREFGHLNLQPPREEREATVLSLRQAGLGERATAAVTGLSKGTVGSITRSAAQEPGAQNWAPDQTDALEEETGMSGEAPRTDGDDGRSYAITRPHVWKSDSAEPAPTTSLDEGADQQVPGQASIADELGEDAGDAVAGSVLGMSPEQAGIPVVDIEATEANHREQARRDLREFHASGQAAVPMTIKLAARLSASVVPAMGDSPLTDEERVGVISDSARCVRTLANLLSRTAAAPEALAADDAAAEEVMTNVTDSVEDLSRAVDGWRKTR